MLTSATGPAGDGFPPELVVFELPHALAASTTANTKNRTCSGMGDSEDEVSCVYPPVGFSFPVAACAAAAVIHPRCGAPPGTPGRSDSGPPGRSARPGAAPPRAPWAPRGASRAAREPRRSSDRKSTRLNSSHLVISYAVFCLKKKKKQH